LVLCLPNAACKEDHRNRLNVVLITIDTLRADRLEPYGSRRVRTPNIQRLAEEGILFEKAFCDTTWTTPSVASLLTGKYPFDHGLQTYLNRLSTRESTLAELFEEQGYRTGAIVGSFPLDRRFGLAQGFDSYDDEVDKGYLRPGSRSQGPKEEWFDGTREEMFRWYMGRLMTRTYRTDRQVAGRAIEWLDQHDDDPFFLWVHFYGPHEKLKPRPRKISERKLRAMREAAYDRDVVIADREVGRFLARLARDPRMDRTAIVLHSDHGETLSEREKPGHGFDLYETTARVPLILRLPGRERGGTRSSRIVRNIDVFPTLLHLAGIEVPEDRPGQDLLAVGQGGDVPAYIESFLHTSAYAADGAQGKTGLEEIRWGLRGLRTSKWKLVVRTPIRAHPDETTSEVEPLPDPEFELYDLEADPDERTNLASSQPDQLERLLALLKSYPERGPGEAGETLELDANARDSLRALGYLE
jgi:arylsulfatase A-like enzyme